MDRCRVLVCLALCAVWHVVPTLGQSQIDINVLARLENLEKQVSVQQNQLEVQNRLIADLQTRVVKQESEIAKQQTTISEQQTTIVDQQKMISEQQIEISKQKSSLSEQHRRLTELEGIVLVQRTGKGNWTRLKTDSGRANNDNKVEVTDETYSERIEADKDHDKQEDRDTSTIGRLNKRLVLEGGSMVAFHAVYRGDAVSHVGIGQKIIFPSVMLNQGSGYHSQSGVFITPAAGLYIFSTSVNSFVSPNSEIQVAVMKNGVTLARAFAHAWRFGSRGSRIRHLGYNVGNW